MEKAGAWADAAQLLNDAFADGIRRRDPLLLLEAVVRLGHCYRRAGEREVAWEYFQLAIVLSELHASSVHHGRSLNGIGLLVQQSGDLDQAERCYRAAHGTAVESRNDLLLGDTQINLGVLQNIRGELHEARKLYENALLAFERAGNMYGYIGGLNNLGMLHVDLHQLDDAHAYFERALALSIDTRESVLEGVIHINRAELFLARDELDLARESCDQGFEIFSRLDDEIRKTEALRFYGVIYRKSGKLHLAETHLRQAIAIAGKSDPLSEAESQRELALVLRAQGKNRQALEALNRSHALFTSLQARPDEADISRRIAQLEGDFLQLVRTWGESIEAKDRYTSGHCARVAAYACRIAERAGMGEGEMVWFRMGAFLHDLGKTEVPEEILNKPGRLTDEERAVMESHTVIGDEMLASVEFPWDVRPMVRSHHERWDGSGYPDGLVGEGIPFAARILRIADVFDALTTARSYRRQLTPEEAFAIMEEDAGSFDPALFAIFCELLPELHETAAAAVSHEDSGAGQ